MQLLPVCCALWHSTEENDAAWGRFAITWLSQAPGIVEQGQGARLAFSRTPNGVRLDAGFPKARRNLAMAFASTRTQECGPGPLVATIFGTRVLELSLVAAEDVDLVCSVRGVPG